MEKFEDTVTCIIGIVLWIAGLVFVINCSIDAYKAIEHVMKLYETL